MLRDMYGCYWFVDEQNRLRIEHIQWFKNGGSYDGEPVVGINLTKIFNVRNSKDWAYCTNEVKFKKEDMAARYEYDWMDEFGDVLSEGRLITAEFDKFYCVIEKSFPTLVSKAKKLTFGGGCFFYVIEGKNADKNAETSYDNKGAGNFIGIIFQTANLLIFKQLKKAELSTACIFSDKNTAPSS